MIKKGLVLLLCLGAFSVGLLSTAWCLGRVFMRFDEFVLRDKVKHLTEHADEYDTLFLGSSRVYHQISPAIFDELARDAGKPTRSFNLGMDALFPPEDSYVLEHILSLRPKNLRWVFVEVSMFLPDSSEKNAESPRSIYWHDWTRTSMALRDLLGGTKKLEWKKRGERWEKWKAALDRCEMHAWMFARKITALGGGGGILQNFLKGKQTKGAKGLGKLHDGYAPLGPPKETGDEVFSYDKLYAKRLEKPIQYRPLSSVGQENLDRILARIRKSGATPVLIVSPALSSMFFVPREPSREVYLEFADIHTWPQLYQKEHFVDAGHLSTAGAELYTRYIVREWLAATGAANPERVARDTPVTSALDVRATIP